MPRKSLKSSSLARRRQPEATVWSRPALQERSRETRDRVLAAAEEAFAAKGYEGARMADIAEAAGCSVGALYQRFKDKDALFSGIAEAFAMETRQRAADALAETKGTPAARLRAFIRMSAAHLMVHRGLVRAILERGFGQPQLLVPLIALRAELHTMVDAVIRAAGRTPEPPTVRVVTQVINGFIQNSVVNPMALSQAGDDSALDELSDIIIGYLGLE
jgi:AcrR family transcriptional regulator